MQRTMNDAPFKPTATERPTPMRAIIGERVKSSLHVKQGEPLALDFD